MRITVTRKGGLAGLAASGTREDSELTRDQRRAIADLLTAPPPPAVSPGADRFQYQVTIQDDQQATHQLALDEEAMPPALAKIPQISL